MQNSYELWRGPSELSGDPVVVIATGLRRPSRNRKTGPMVQIWILPQDEDPSTAYRSQGDAARAVCGDCPHLFLGSCYVDKAKAPLSIWKAWRAGRIGRAPLSIFRYLYRHSATRAGADGDPAAAPAALWRILRPTTGYTHAWRQPRLQGLREFLMASCDTADDVHAARAMGWRCFQVRTADDCDLPGMIECPADSRGIACADCRLCDGTAGGRRPAGSVKDIWIRAHGVGGKTERFTDWRRAGAPNMLTGEIRRLPIVR